MDILEPWLVVTIEQELSEALRYWGEGRNGYQSAGHSRELSYDDGSNLRILSAKKGPVVQITKFLTFQDPIQVTLSDSIIRVNASIANQASQRYAEETRRKLTQGTLGGLIQLLEFEIVATHFGPRDKRLTLYVKDFKSLAGEESGTFGVAPQAIESREGTKKLLNTLADLRRQGLDGHSRQSAAESPMRSQPSTQTSEAANDQDSQIGFATQVPRSGTPILSESKSLGSTTGVHADSTFTADSAKTLAYPMKVKHGNILKGTQSPLQAKAAPERPSTTQREVLLGLLRKNKHAPPAPEHNPDQTSRQLPARVTVSREHVTGERESRAFRVNTLAPSDANAARTPIETHKRKRQSSETSPRKKTSNDSDLRKTDHNRISRRDVSIPKDQETLLARADAWLPAEPGQREPSANIPISLLTRLNQKAAFRAQRPIKLRKQGNGTVTTNTTIDRTADSDSDAPISPGQWPPSSPERAQLPPDSDSASADHSDHSAHRTACSASLARRPSNASISSRSIRSGPPSPISARQSLGATRSLGITPPTALSPSVTSTSAGEEDHHFTCHVLGCDKSYKRSGDLEAHADLHHASTESLDNFKCPLKDFTKSYASADGIKNHVERQHDGNSALSSLSGSATSTIPGVSTPMSTGPKSWNERDRGSGQIVPNIEANDQLDSVEVSASMPLLLDGRSKSLREEEVQRRHPSIEYELRSNIPPNTPPAPIQPATINPDGTYVAQEPYSSPVPSSPNSESDLELTVPLALNQTTDSAPGSAPLQSFPCTASQPQDPFTQVKRTPYVDSRVHNKSLPALRVVSSPLKSNLYPLVNGNVDNDTEFVSASVTSDLGASTAETPCHIRSSHTIEDQRLGDIAAKIAEDVDSQEVPDSSAETPDEVIAENQRETTGIEIVAEELDKTAQVITGVQRQNFRLDPPALLLEASIHSSTVPGKLFVPESNHREHLPQPSASDHMVACAREVKRKVADASFVSPGLTKRQKRLKVPSAFTITERSDVLRDPSERARQYRQEFLASRRSSESSTPATSPRTQLTSLTETIQAQCRNAGMEQNLEQVSLQAQSVDTGNEMAESKDLPATPQSKGLSLGIAPFLNGTTSVETDSDDAKPGAQDNAPSEYETDSPLLATQDADVEAPDAKRSSVNKASFCATNDEIQRARSVELNLSVPSPDHGEAEDGIANGKDEADPTVNLGAELNVTDPDQSENRNDGSRPAKPKSDEARKDLPTRADEVAPQETDALTPKALLDHVAELENAAPSVAVDANTQRSDEITKESTSNQLLVGVDTNSWMTDIRVSQDVPSLKTVAPLGELMKRTTPLLSVDSPLVTDSKAEDQRKLSPTARPTIPLSNLMLDSNVLSVEKHGIPMQLAMESTQQEPLSVAQSVFDLFKATYPTYPGDMKHFAAICKKISRLVKLSRMEHQSLWDDFIVRHKVEYSQYLRRCAEEAEDAVPYEIFYQTQIEGPQYQKRVVNRRNLDEALAPFARQPSFEQVDTEPIGGVKSHKTDRQPSESRVVIDLTEDDPPDDPQSKLLQSVNGVYVEPRSLQHCQDPLSSLNQVPSTSTTMRGSHVPSSPQSIRPPFVSATSSTTNATKSLRRSLPWENSGHQFLPSSAKEKASDSSKELPAFGLGEMCAKRINTALDRVEKQNEGTPAQWWDDDNSPFKSFARAYASIRHGNGNSFAKIGVAESGDGRTVEENTSRGVQLKKINIMRWNL